LYDGADFKVHPESSHPKVRIIPFGMAPDRTMVRKHPRVSLLIPFLIRAKFLLIQTPEIGPR
jgi:hypothetical protein